MTGRTGYVTHSDCSRHDTGWKHPDHQGRLPAVARAVHRDMLTLFDHLREIEGVPATITDLQQAHTEEYVARVQERCGEAHAAGQPLPLAGDVVVSGASWEAALAAVGCVLTAVEQVEAGEVANAFCAVRPPGHGASADAPGSFSLFNSVAIGALRLRRGTDARRVWVVEWGSRPGAGTVSLLREEKGVRFVSVHSSAEPAESATSEVAITRRLEAGSGLAEMMDALRDALDQAERELPPDFILLSLGCDALAGDPLGTLALMPRDYHPLTAELKARADRLCAGRLVSVLEEGYDEAAMATAVVQHLRALAALPPQEG